MKVNVYLKDRKFYYADFGYERHGKTSFRLWVSEKLVKEGSYIEFPLKAKLVKTQKGSIILKPSEKDYTYYIFVRCGYRGNSYIDFEEPFKDIVWFYHYHSELGKLGVSSGCLVTSEKDSIVYKWEKTGRLYGAPSQGKERIFADGKIVEEIDDEELLNELEKL